MTHPRSCALPAEARKYARHSAGLFVGLNHYDDPEIRQLRFAVDDAIDLAHLFVIELGLLEPSKTSLLLAGEPAKAESKRRLEELSSKGCLQGRPWLHELYQHADRFGHSTAEEGLIVAFFSTRGFDSGAQGMLAVGGTLKRKAVQTGLPLAMILDELSKARARNRLVLLDVCRESPGNAAGVQREPSELLGEGFLRSIDGTKGSTVLTATSRGGFSFEDERDGNGVFAGAVMDGLRGDAQPGEQADVAVEMLASYLHQQIRDWVAKRRPEQAGINQGILARFDPESMRSFALARPLQPPSDLYEEHVRQMLARLLREVGPKDRLFRQAVHALDGAPSHERAQLLAEIRSFDGSQRSRRTLGTRLIELIATPAPLQLAVAVSPGTADKTPGASPPPAEAEAAEPGVPSRRGSASLFTETGVDSFGTWALLRVGSAVQRMRWIEPGSFWMGSRSEERRTEDYFQMARHRVTLTQGFWMADTPCTQAFWKEVAGKNPSVFKTPNRPVDRTSWNRAQNFVLLLQARLKGVQITLPTEAQWEFACRAGTETDTYAGDLQVLGNMNAPVLNAIAWYGGNSGVNYDLEIGLDSTQWKEKQFPHTKAGTREVGKKAPNGWGLYDMLGNVKEWCRDAGGLSGDAGERIDPHCESGNFRILRGGCATDDAWHARAFHRSLLKPEQAFIFTGFRFILT